MDSFRSQKKLLLSNDILCKFTFVELTNYIKNNENLENIKDFMNSMMSHLNLDIRFNLLDIKIFLSCYLFMYHDDIILKNKDDVNEKMKSLSFDLYLSFEELFSDYCLKNCLKFKEYYLKYVFFFKQWKKRDGLIMIRPILKSYFELEVIRDDFKKNNNDDYLHLNRQLKQLENNIKLICGDDGLIYLKQKKIPIFKTEKMYNDVEKTVKKAFWDSFEENIEENKLNQIPPLLNDIKNMIKSMIVNKKYLSNLDNNINIEMISNVINSPNPDFKFIYNLINYLIEKLFELQQPSEDSNTKLFKNNIDDMFNKNNKTSYLLRYFFENYFIKLENIKTVTIHIKENIKIEEI